MPSKKIFEDPRELAKLFTKKRQELVKEVKLNPPASISQLAENLEKKMRCMAISNFWRNME